MRWITVLLINLCSTGGVAFRVPLPVQSLGIRPSSAAPSARPSSLDDLSFARRNKCGPISTRGHSHGLFPWTMLGSSKEDDQHDADGGIEASPSSDSPERGGMRGAMDRLKGYGLAGVIAYGLLNQLYYCTAFAFFWLGPLGASAIVAPATAGVGANVAVSAKQFGKVATLVWIGSQATKPARVAVALFLAPAAEVVLASTERRLRLPSRQHAFWVLFVAIVGSSATFCATAVAYAAVRATAQASTTTAAQASSSVAAVLGGVQSGNGDVFSGGRGGSACMSCSGGRGDGGVERANRRGRFLFRRRRSGAAAVAASVLGGVAGTTQQPPPPARAAAPHSATPSGDVGESSAQGGGEGGAAMGLVGRRRGSGKRISPQKAADLNPPPQDNIHGWKEQPNHLLGFWEVGAAEPLPALEEGSAEEAVAAAAPAVAAAAALAAAATSFASSAQASPNPRNENADAALKEDRGHLGIDSSGGSLSPRDGASSLEAGGFSYREVAGRDMVDLGSDILHHVRYVVLKRDGSMKAGPAGIGVSPRSWRFTPANRRIVFELDVPGRGVTLRYTARLKRLPGVFTQATGIIRMRPMSDATGETNMPKSSRRWPKLAEFTMKMHLKEKFKHTKPRTDKKGDETPPAAALEGGDALTV